MRRFETSTGLRLPKTLRGLIYLPLGLCLSACSLLQLPPQADRAPSPQASAFALRQAENRGYLEGFQAGKQVQANLDARGIPAARVTAGAHAATPVHLAPPPVVPATSAPTVAQALPAVTPGPGQGGYVPRGPAMPLGNSSAPF